jgi:hypothetical protein
MTLRWNPFTRANHNQWNGWPRAFFHLTHVALGVPFLALGILLHLTWPIVLIIATLCALAEKRVWVDWHRTSGRLFHWTAWEITDWPDFWSDLGLTLLGAGLFITAPFTSLVAWLVTFYALSTFNGT